jgi:hypothetical protein
MSDDMTSGGPATFPMGAQVVAYGAGIDPLVSPRGPIYPYQPPMPDDALQRALERLRMEPDALARELREIKELLVAMQRQKMGSPLDLIRKLVENMIVADPAALDEIEAVCRAARAARGGEP